MVFEELAEHVKRLADEDKRRLFWMLRNDPALAEIAPEVTGLRYNYEAARILLSLLEDNPVECQVEAK